MIDVNEDLTSDSSAMYKVGQMLDVAELLANLAKEAIKLL